MSTEKGLRAGWMALVFVGMALAVSPAQADRRFTTELPASILLFPKVVNTSDTIIQITNTGTDLAYAHCFYVNGQSLNGVPGWQVTDFELVLTRQQPTYWSVANGRAMNFGADPAGLDPGSVPPVPVGFTGSLLCVETDSSGDPVGGEDLKGEATTGEVNGLAEPNGVSKYNAVGIQACSGATETCPAGQGLCCDNTCSGDCTGQNQDNVLSLDGNEYAACPGGAHVNFEAEGGPDAAIDGVGGGKTGIVSTSLTMIPCGMDLENLLPPSTSANITVRDEYEAVMSLDVDVACWYSNTIGSIGAGEPLSYANFGTTYGTMVLVPPGGAVPVVGVANVRHAASDGTSDDAAMNLFFCNTDPAGSSVPQCPMVDSAIYLPAPY